MLQSHHAARCQRPLSFTPRVASLLHVTDAGVMMLLQRRGVCHGEKQRCAVGAAARVAMSRMSPLAPARACYARQASCASETPPTPREVSRRFEAERAYAVLPA